MDVFTGFRNGEYCPENEIKILVDNLAVGRAYAVYEFFGVYGGKVFCFDRHLKRLFNSLNSMKLTLSYKPDEIEGIVEKLIELNQLKTFYVKVYAIPGKLGKAPFPCNLYIIPCDIPPLPAELYNHGASLIMREYLRFLPEAKSTNYIASVYWHNEMEESGAIDILYCFNNEILECSRGNIFLVKNEKVYTPGNNILSGISRGIVIDLFEECGIPYEIKSIGIDELFGADEVFITSTTKRVMPVVRIDGRTIGKGNPGTFTSKISRMYLEFLQSGCY
jgi:branched-chain amino acid aminotransferase